MCAKIFKGNLTISNQLCVITTWVVYANEHAVCTQSFPAHLQAEVCWLYGCCLNYRLYVHIFTDPLQWTVRSRDTCNLYDG